MKTLAKTLPIIPDGNTNELPDTTTTCWYEDTYVCPNHEHHKVVGSTRIVTCPECKIYWKRSNI